MTRWPRLAKEVRSAVTNRRFIRSAYCTGSGRSRPKSFRTASSVSGVALRPAMRAEGSAPGVAKKIKNTTTLIPNMTKSICAMRGTMTAIMASPLQPGAGIERVTHAVTQEIERQHGDHDRKAWGHGHGGTCVQEPLAVQDDGAPARVGRLNAHGQEGKRRLGGDVQRHHQRDVDNQRGGYVRQDIAHQDPPGRHAETHGGAR